MGLLRVGRFARFGSAARDVGDALRFFTRLPAPGSGESAPLDFNRIAWAAPVAGVIVGLIGAGALGLTRLFGLPPFLCAGLATAAMVAATGALPEDGLSDVAGGFGGGSTRERKLEIMRDSRIGFYGAVALALVLILRAAALASALAHDFLAPRRGAKTSLKDARADGFDFLGYRFGPRYGQKGKRYLGARPSAKSLKRIKGKISDLLRPGNMGAWPQVRGWLNRLLGGWSAYFSYGTLNAAYRSVDRHVCDRVRRFLNRRSKRDGPARDTIPGARSSGNLKCVASPASRSQRRP